MSLSEYLIAYLGNLAEILGWEESNLPIVVEDTLSDYGVSTEAEATDTRKLRLLGKVNLWKKALVELSSKYNFSADGASFSQSQFYEMVLKNYERACNEALEYMPNYQIQVGEVITEHDPYQYLPWEDRSE